MSRYLLTRGRNEQSDDSEKSKDIVRKIVRISLLELWQVSANLTGGFPAPTKQNVVEKRLVWEGPPGCHLVLDAQAMMIWLGKANQYPLHPS